MSDDSMPAARPRTVEDTVTRITGGGELNRTDSLVPLSTRVPESLRKRLRLAAINGDVAVQDIIIEAASAWLDKNERR